MLKNMSNVSKNNSNRLKRPQSNGGGDSLNDTEDFFSCSSTQENLLGNGGGGNPTNSTKIDDTLALLSSEIKHIWQMIIESSRCSPESLGLFEDNLSSLLTSGAISSECVETMIKDQMKQMTHSLFKLSGVNPSDQLQREVQQQTGSVCPFHFGYEFGLNTHANGALNLFTQQLIDLNKKKNALFASSSEKESSFVSPLTIAATFRLFSSLERGANLLALKDYIGWPILTIRKEELYR